MITKVKPGIVVFPGSNCDMDMAVVLRDLFGLEPVVIWHADKEIPSDVSHVVLPGGFSYGDYVRAGAMAAQSSIMPAVKDFAALGYPILGICNGFQILCEAKLLPGVLLKNHHDRFVCKVVPTTWFGGRSKLSAARQMNLPIAHREGRYFADRDTILELKNNEQIVLTYDERDQEGNATVNGSMDAIAGIVGGPQRNILGLMPHPERMAIKTLLGDDGLQILKDFLFG